MPMEIVTVKFDKDKEVFQSEELQKFILNKKINNYKAEFFNDNGKPYWSIFIDYDIILDEKQKPNSINNLSEAESLLFTKLKEWRKLKSNEKGFPVYLVATNDQLIKMVKERMTTLISLKTIQGFGQKRIDTYGNEIVEMIKNFWEINK